MLVDREGQARVVDFGLARPADAVANVAGTPAYMAPEVLRGEPATARADQFSLGVALYEALTGKRPYDARTVEGLVAAIAAPRPRIAGVPRALDAAVARCLEPAPARRFPDLGPVIDALAPRAASRVWLPVAGAATAVAVGAVVWAWQRAPAVDDPCATAGVAIERAWNAAARSAIEAALARTNVSYAGDTRTRVDASLERYAQRWRSAAGEACRAASPLRETCLDDRRRQLAAVVARLGEADARTVEHAVAMVDALPGPEDCADTSRLAERLPVPEAAAARIAAARDRLAIARATLLAGDAKAAQAATAALVNDVDAIAYAPLSAELQLLFATAAALAGDLAAAEPAFERAYREGIAGRHDEAAAGAAIKLAHLRGHVRAKPDDGRPWLANADALVRRIGDARDLAAELANVTGNIEQTAGHYDLALAAFERAERAWRSVPGDHALDVAMVQHDAGNAQMLAGRTAAALASLRAALATMREAVGAGHPYVAMTTTSLTSAMREDEDFAGAYELDRVVLAAEIARVGPDHPDVGFAEGAIGNDLRGLARYGEAREHFTAARRIFATAMGPEHPLVAGTDSNLGGVLAALGRYDEADALLRTALAAKEKRGPTHPALISTLDTLGTVALRRGRAGEARAYFERSLAIGEAALGKDAPELATTLGGLADAIARAGKPAEARPLLVRALALAPPRAQPPILVVLGRVRYALGERADGRAQVEEALARLTAPAQADERERARDWLAHAPP